MTKWESIEIAPKDGTRILLFCDRVLGNIRTGYWYENNQEGYNASGWWLDGFGHPFNVVPFTPSFWMPLPESPNE